MTAWSSGRAIGDVVLNHPDLAGIHFAGSTGVFNGMWRSVGQNLEMYRSCPRLVGETGGKDFIFAHPSADPKSLTTAILRGAFEYQGRSAARRRAPTSPRTSGRRSRTSCSPRSRV